MISSTEMNTQHAIPLFGIPHPGPEAPNKDKSAFLACLRHLPQLENDIYLSLSEVYEPSGRIGILRLAAFLDVYDPHEGGDWRWKMLSRSVKIIPQDAVLSLWMEAYFARDVSGGGDGLELSEERRICCFPKGIFDRVSINRSFYGQIAHLDGPPHTGELWRINAHWGIVGESMQTTTEIELQL